jgi:hypothetical protein
VLVTIGRRVDEPEDERVATQCCYDDCRNRSAMRSGQRRERRTLQAEQRVLSRQPGRVAMHPEMLERVQPGRRLRDEQCDQGQEYERRFPGSDQGSYLCREADGN